ncbi:hypothetical protein [Bdellovibrio sp. HCB274]|uniref:hypothetical protein n=1 Tax=Bdellovibrio sp. HCB274 TaxID=3394361 RepID=UPI0039B37238
MKLWIRVATPMAIVLGFAVNAQAQMYGVGLAGGMQACPYNYGAGQAATSEDDAVSEIQQSIAQMQKDKAEKKRELQKAERDMKYAKRDIDDVISSDYSSTLYEHMDNSRSCSEYQGYMPNGPIVTADMGEDEAQPQDDEGKSTAGSFSPVEWNGTDGGRNYVCNRNQRGSVNPGVCVTPKFQNKDRRVGNTEKCKKSLTAYGKSVQTANRLRDDIEAIDRSIEYAKDDLKDARKDALQARQDAQRGTTEAGICTTGDCATTGNGYRYVKPQTDWTSVIANVGMGILGMYMGKQANEYSVDAAANLGYPMNPTPYWMGGMPYMATGLTQAFAGGSGVYGAQMSSGIGAGGFGCYGQNGGPYGMYGPYGGANGTGMWGNPYAMGMMNPYAQMGGGIYAPGMGPWGVAGPWGMGMGPYANGGASFVNGIANGFMGSYPGGMMGSMMGGNMMGNMMGTYMGGGMAYPGAMIGGMASGGMYMGAYPGAMMGSMMGNMMGGMMGSYMGGMYSGGMAYPGAMVGGIASGGAFMGAYPGGMMGSMMGGMAGSYMGGMYSGGMAYPGAMVGGIAGGGMYMGSMMGSYMGGMAGYMGSMMGAMSSGYAGDMGMMQMQQQMMQMQMQQYQSAMAQQQAYMQSQMQRQQASASVVSEIMNLQQKLYYIQSGAFSGSTGYIGGSGSSGYYPVGAYSTTTMPGGVIMGGSGTATTPIGGGVTVPGSIPAPTGTTGTGVGVGTGR